MHKLHAYIRTNICGSCDWSIGFGALQKQVYRTSQTGLSCLSFKNRFICPGLTGLSCLCHIYVRTYGLGAIQKQVYLTGRTGLIVLSLQLVLPLCIRAVDNIIHRRLRFGYDVGKGFVVGEEEMLQQFDRLSGLIHRKIAHEFRRRAEATRLEVIQSLGTYMYIHCIRTYRYMYVPTCM